MNINKKHILKILFPNGHTIDERENEELEFKESFSLSALPDYYRSFAGFANNKGGCIIFGVKDSPRKLVGLIEKSRDQFQNIDSQRITQDLLEVFSANIQWSQTEVVNEGKTFGVFKILASHKKPVIAKKNYGKNQVIKAAEVYYRYAGRTQKIQYAELEAIVQARIEKNTNQWMDLMSKIAQVGPQNAAILEVKGDSNFENGSLPIFTMDAEHINEIKDMQDRNILDDGSTQSIDLNKDKVPFIGVIPNLKENLLMFYPLSAIQLAQAVKEKLPDASRHKVWEVIKKNNMKDNTEYSVYNFRNKMHEDQYKESGKLATGTPSIYNYKAVDFIVTLLKN